MLLLGRNTHNYFTRTDTVSRLARNILRRGESSIKSEKSIDSKAQLDDSANICVEICKNSGHYLKEFFSSENGFSSCPELFKDYVRTHISEAIKQKRSCRLNESFFADSDLQPSSGVADLGALLDLITNKERESSFAFQETNIENFALLFPIETIFILSCALARCSNQGQDLQENADLLRLAGALSNQMEALKASQASQVDKLLDGELTLEDTLASTSEETPFNHKLCDPMKRLIDFLYVNWNLENTEQVALIEENLPSKTKNLEEHLRFEFGLLPMKAICAKTYGTGMGLSEFILSSFSTIRNKKTFKEAKKTAVILLNIFTGVITLKVLIASLEFCKDWQKKIELASERYERVSKVVKKIFHSFVFPLINLLNHPNVYKLGIPIVLAIILLSFRFDCFQSFALFCIKLINAWAFLYFVVNIYNINKCRKFIIKKAQQSILKTLDVAGRLQVVEGLFATRTSEGYFEVLLRNRELAKTQFLDYVMFKLDKI